MIIYRIRNIVNGLYCTGKFWCNSKPLKQWNSDGALIKGHTISWFIENLQDYRFEAFQKNKRYNGCEPNDIYEIIVYDLNNDTALQYEIPFEPRAELKYGRPIKFSLLESLSLTRQKTMLKLGFVSGRTYTVKSPNIGGFTMIFPLKNRSYRSHCIELVEFPGMGFPYFLFTN